MERISPGREANCGQARQVRVNKTVVGRKRKTIPTKDLREVRKQRGLTLRDVYERSLRIAKKRGQREFVIPPSRLHEFERQGIVPSIFRIYTLARIYNHSLPKVLSWYGIPKR